MTPAKGNPDRLRILTPVGATLQATAANSDRHGLVSLVLTTTTAGQMTYHSK